MKLEKINRKIKEGYATEEIVAMSGLSTSYIEGLRVKDPVVKKNPVVKKHNWHKGNA